MLDMHLFAFIVTHQRPMTKSCVLNF